MKEKKLAEIKQIKCKELRNNSLRKTKEVVRSTNHQQKEGEKGSESKQRFTAVFLVSSGGQCGDEQNMKISTFGTHRVQHLGHIGPKVASRLW